MKQIWFGRVRDGLENRNLLTQKTGELQGNIAQGLQLYTLAIISTNFLLLLYSAEIFRTSSFARSELTFLI